MSPREVTSELLKEFFKWTKEAPMFLTSEHGAKFAKELQTVLELAEIGLQAEREGVAHPRQHFRIYEPENGDFLGML